LRCLLLLLPLLLAAPAQAEPVTRAPAVVREATPDYPDALREAGVGGAVLLELDLDETGRPFAVTVLEGAHPELDEAARVAALRLRFSPALVDGEPLPSTVTWRFTFTPDGQDAVRRSRRVRPGEEPEFVESVVVTAERPWRVFLQEREAPVEGEAVGAFRVGRRDIELTPGALSDVNMVLHSLPAVSRSSFFVGNYSVRGGDPADNVTLLDGVRLDAPDVQGLLSRFNPNLVDAVTVYGGSQPASLSESIAGVTDIAYVDPAADRFHALVDLNLLSVSGQVMGPLGEAGAPASFVLAVRRALTDLYLEIIEAAGVYEGLKFGFGDVFARFHFELGPERRSRLDVTGLFSDDTITLAPDDAIATVDRTLHALGSVRHRWEPSDRFAWSQQFAITWASERNLRDDVLFRDAADLELAGRSDWRVGLWQTSEALLGVEYRHRFLRDQGTAFDVRRRPAWIEAAWADEGALRIDLDTRRELSELALYGEAGWTSFLGLPLEGRVGLRWTPVNSSAEGVLSPRVGLAARLPTGTALKLHASLTHQFPDAIGLFDPALDPGGLDAARSVLISGAVEQSFDVGLHLRFEAYNRSLSHLLVWPDTDEALEQTPWATVGTGFARGFDVSLGLRRPGWGLWGSYSFLHTRRTNPLNVRGPKTFEPWFSTPHMVKLGGDLRFGRRRDLTLSASLTMAQGRPFSPAVHVFDRGERAWLGEAYDYGQQRWGWQNAASVRLEYQRVIKGRFKVSVYADLANIQLDRNMTVMRARERDYELGVRPALPELFDAARFPLLPWVGFRGEL